MFQLWVNDVFVKEFNTEAELHDYAQCNCIEYEFTETEHPFVHNLYTSDGEYVDSFSSFEDADNYAKEHDMTGYDILNTLDEESMWGC